MTFKLVDAGWSDQIEGAVRADSSSVCLISPFIKTGAVSRIEKVLPKTTRVITRFSLSDFAAGASDIGALGRLLKTGATVRGIRNLHAKVYLFGATRAIITSANLTSSALDRNHEFGVVTEAKDAIAACQAYFDQLWNSGGADLTPARLAEWQNTVTERLLQPQATTVDLPDFGTDVGLRPTPVWVPPAIGDAGQAFVKFLGEGNNREPLDWPILDEIKRAGCHWALTYPASKRPRTPQDGALMFIARLSKDPNDIRIFGRAVGMAHLAGRDDATPEEITARSWKQQWPRYIRVHKAEFLAGTIRNGLSLNEMMSELKADSFASTQRHARDGNGNIDPRKAYSQQPHVELSPQGQHWLSERLQRAFNVHGTISQDELARLDWPPPPPLGVPSGAGSNFRGGAEPR